MYRVRVKIHFQGISYHELAEIEICEVTLLSLRRGSALCLPARLGTMVAYRSWCEWASRAGTRRCRSEEGGSAGIYLLTTSDGSAIIAVFTQISSESNSAVECHFPKVKVAGSNPVSRSLFWPKTKWNRLSQR